MSVKWRWLMDVLNKGIALTSSPTRSFYDLRTKKEERKWQGNNPWHPPPPNCSHNSRMNRKRKKIRARIFPCLIMRCTLSQNTYCWRSCSNRHSTRSSGHVQALMLSSSEGIISPVVDPNMWRWQSQPVVEVKGWPDPCTVLRSGPIPIPNSWLIAIGPAHVLSQAPNTAPLVTLAGRTITKKKNDWIQCLCIQTLYISHWYCGFYYKPSCFEQLCVHIYLIYSLRTFPSGGTLGRGHKTLGVRFAKDWGAMWRVTPNMEGVVGPVTVADRPVIIGP